MNYKHITLIVLFLPAAIYGKSAKIDLKINDLKEFRLKKIVELVSICKTLEDFYPFLGAIGDEFFKTIAQKDLDTANQLLMLEMRQSITDHAEEKSLKELENCDIRMVGVENSELSLETKLCLLQSAATQRYLDSLFNEYAECIQALIDNDQELSKLAQEA